MSKSLLDNLWTMYRGKFQGITKTRFYKIWMGMNSRCNDIKNVRYGGKGIRVCDRWLNFINFYEDMFPYYKDGLTIERINSNGNYTKENCRWATYKEQARNIKTNRLITYKGQTLVMRDWADKLEINYKTLSQRINAYGWSYERALNTGRNYFG